MFEVSEGKKKSKRIWILCMVFLIVLAVADFWVDRDVILNRCIDFYELEALGEGVSGDSYVSLRVNAVLSNYAQTKHTVNLIPTGTDQHYLIWLDNDEIISLKIRNKKQIKLLNNICDGTWDYLNAIYQGETDVTLPEEITVKGVIHSFTPEMRGYYNQTLNEIGIAEGEFRVYYVEVDATKTRGKSILYFLIIVAAVVAGVYFFIKSRRNSGS